MSSGGSTSRTGSAQKWAKPFAINAANETQSVYNDAQPGLQNITGQVQGMLPGIQAKYEAGNPVLNAASGYDVNLLGRDPYAGSSQLNNLINSTGQHVMDQTNANFGSRGSFGGTAHTEAVARALADNENGLRYQDAQNVMGMQQQASAGAPQKAAADYLGISPLLQAAQLGAQLPYTGTTALSGSLSELFNGGKTVTQPDTLGSLMKGAGSAASAAAASDRRVKENIERVGELPDGLGVYRWNYVWDGPETRHEGVMADEVAALRPWALGPEIAGYATVVYGAL